MKQTRTTLKALTAAYRAVLRHGILCNAIALGLIATAPAMAERLILDEETTLTGQTFTGNSVTAISVDTEKWTGTPEEPVVKTNAYLWTSPTDRTLQKDTEGKYIKGDIEQYTYEVKSSIAAGDEAKGGAVYSTAALTISGGEFSDNVANGALTGQKVKDVYRKQEGWEDFVLESDNGGDKRTLDGAYGGAVYAGAGLTINNDAVFANNRSDKYGGAVYVVGNIDVDGASFTNNEGGAIYVDTGGTVAGSVKNATFTGNTGNSIYSKNAKGLNISDSTFSGNSGAKVVENRSGNLDITNSTFTNNDGGILLLGAGTTGAVSSLRGITATGNTSSSRSNMYLYGKSGKTLIEDSTFSNNTTIGNDGGVVMIVNNSDGPAVIRNSKFIENSTQGDSSATGGAVAFGNSVSYTGTGNEYTGNHAGTNGGALANTASANLITEIGATFSGNSADGDGGAIWFNTGNNYSLVASIVDSSFVNNTANGQGGAIHNAHNKGETKKTTLNLIAKDSDVMFSGNIADGEANDIYNASTLNLVAAEGRTISLGGGIDGDAGTININKDISYDYYEENDGTFTRKNASVTSPNGTVEIFGALKNQTVDLGAGELHLNNTDLTGSTVTVASGATLNSIDNLINDYSSNITLADGALVKGDIDYTAGLADTYSADSGANITYKLANALNLSGVQYGSKEIAITNTGATVNADVNFAWFNGDTGLTLTSGGNGTGTVLVSGVAGGINAAVDATDETVQEITYTASAASETFDGADNVIQNADFTITGNGNDTDSNKIVFENDMIVDGSSTLALNNINLEKTDGEAITNQLGGNLHITDSRIGVNINNMGTMVSDPTYYGAEVVNVGTASFTGDVFESGSSLTNSAIVDLNNVEFKSGSSLIGNAGNTLNLVGTGNIFNGSSTGNNVVLASGANYTGTLYDGVVDARNGGIDTITGSVSGGDLYVDANLTSGEVDTFGGTSGATIKGIKLANAGYGTEDKVELAIGEATLANDLNIDGINYYTSVVKDGDNIVFSDKLINESNLYSKLAWDAGTYIKPSVSLENTGDDYMTVGQALTELDTRIATLNGDASTDGSVSKSISDALVDLAASNTYDTYGAADTALTDAKAYVDGKGYQTASDVDSAMDAKVTALDLDNTYAAKGDVADSFTAVHGEINDAISAAAEDATTKADAALAASKDYVDGKGYQTADDVTGAINSALAGYTTTDGMSTAIDSAIGDALADYTTTSDMTDAIATAKGEAISSAKDYTDGAIETALADYTTTTDMNTAIDSAIGDALADYTTTSDMTDAIATAKGEAISSAKDYTDGAIETALADYTTTAGITTVVNEAVEAAFGDGSVVANAVDERIEASLADDGAINTAISGATKMGTDGDDSVSMYAHFDEGASVTEAAAALDTAVSATESDIATLKGEEGTAGSVKNTAKGYADTAENNAKTFATSAVDSLANGAVADNTAALSLLNGDANTEGSVAYAAANAVATANAYTDSKLNEVRDSAVAASNAYTDRRIEDLDKNLSAGVAGAVALSSVAVSGVERGEVSVGAGYGYFNGQSAAAFGATMGLSNRWSVNAGAGISNADVSFRAGTNYKFKLF